MSAQYAPVHDMDAEEDRHGAPAFPQPETYGGTSANIIHWFREDLFDVVE